MLTSYARNASLPRHAMILKPSAMDIRAQAPGHPRGGRASGAIASAALLLGGDSGDCRYASAEWDDLIAFVAASHARLGTRWSIGNSRRTPDSVSDALSRRVEQGAPAIARFIERYLLSARIIPVAREKAGAGA